MFNKNVTNILQQINGITNSVILKYPTTVINSDAGDIIVKMNMSKLDTDEFADLGIYNLSEFLNTFKLFSDDRKVQINDNNIDIQDGNTTASYISSKISLLSEYDKDENVFTVTDNVPTVAEFILSVDDIKKLKQASGVFKELTDISIVSQDGDIELSLNNTNSFNAKSNTFKIQKEAETSKEFSIKVPVENFNVIPSSDYNIKVKYNDSKNAYRLILESTEVEDFKILLAIKK